MDVDLDLCRHKLRVTTSLLVHRTASLARLSAIDISLDHRQGTFVFIHGFGGQASQWYYQLQKFSLENRGIAPDLRGHGLCKVPVSGGYVPHLLSDLEIAFTLLKMKGMPLETLIDLAWAEPESTHTEKEKFGGLTERERTGNQL